MKIEQRNTAGRREGTRPETGTVVLESEMLELPGKYESLREKKILVTGAAGFIGGALFRRLTEYRLDVIGTVLYPEEALQLKREGYRVEVLDLASPESWEIETLSGEAKRPVSGVLAPHPA